MIYKRHSLIDYVACFVIDNIVFLDKNLSTEEINALKEEIPLNRMGKPIDIYRCAKWLVEDKYITVQVISVNGGWVI